MRCCVLNAGFSVRLCMMLLVAVALGSCAGKGFQTGSSGLSGAAEPPAAVPIIRETGIASWYGKDFHGRKTASGEQFDMFGISAAHRTLSLGTIIRVTNLDNLRKVEVRVNDRGPFVGTRILELSYGAARELGFLAQGTARIAIEALERPDDRVSLYTVHAAVYSEEENAKLLQERLSQKFEVVRVVPFESNLGRFYRVRVGSYGTEEKAEQVAGKLKLEGLEPYVIRKD